MLAPPCAPVGLLQLGELLLLGLQLILLASNAGPQDLTSRLLLLLLSTCRLISELPRHVGILKALHAQPAWARQGASAAACLSQDNAGDASPFCSSCSASEVRSS